ncbi:MAG: hypothetical protein P1V51_20115 [Deltaproteobacteria bacterium]|nr:hypothetical protein [Deltaproteobacteria bacterium]
MNMQKFGTRKPLVTAGSPAPKKPAGWFADCGACDKPAHMATPPTKAFEWACPCGHVNKFKV